MKSQPTDTIIWTTHALDRLKDRKMKKSMVIETISSPASLHNAKNGAIEHIREFGKHKVTVITKRTRAGEQIIISVWIDPPMRGTADERKHVAWQRYKKAGFWGKLIYVIRRQLGWI